MFINACMQEILVLTKSSVPPPLHVSGCEIAYNSRHILSMFKCGIIGHPCHNYCMKAVRKGRPLTSVTWGTQLSEIMYFFKVIHWPVFGFQLYWSWAKLHIFCGIYFTFKMSWKLNYLRKTFFLKQYIESFALALG